MDMTTLSPLKQEMFSLSDKLIKTMLFENPAKVDGIYIPSTFIIINELQKNTITRMYYSNMQRTHNKPEEFFTLASIKK